jgi:LuxR family transcriptional regulator, maltose regulon positive regulatory protein
VSTRRPHLRIAQAGNADLHNDVGIASATDGETLLRNRGLDALSEALGRARSDTAWSRFWRGYVLQFKDLTLARAEWLQAENGFAHDNDALGLELSACGLVQCALLDNLSYVAFEAHAGRVAAATSTDDANPLTLFRLAARLLLALERRDATLALDDDIDRAFLALGSGAEPETALRVATAALPLLGLGLDRVRSDDFVRAGTALAASPRIGDYSRALWHLYVVESRFYDATWSARLHGELDAIDRLGLSDVLHSFRARAHMLRAALALGAGDTAGGRASLDAAHPLLRPAHPRDYWTFHYYASRHALMVGQLEDAWDHAQACHRKQIEACVPEGGRTTIMMQEGFVLVALGRLEEAAAAFERAAELSLGVQATPCLAHVHLSRALLRWHCGAHGEARAELTVAFAHARSIDLTHFFRALPHVAAELCGAALQLEADAPFARKVIAARALACPDIAIASWPWPLRVHTLGGFAMERDGAPVKFSRKAPKRLLDLLRLVIVLGGRHADLGRVAATLWPEAGGEEAHDALKAMLHRTRALLGDEILVVRDNQIAFDERGAWLDTWALEHVVDRIEAQLGAGIGAPHVDDGELEIRRTQLLSLYRGHLFGEAETPFWTLTLRDRLRARFIRSVDALGQRLECIGRAEDAITTYRAGLEHDNLAEELYQRLIACHLARGEPAQALNTYRRCRELLSIVLGLKPSARTEALAARIAGSRGGA